MRYFVCRHCDRPCIIAMSQRPGACTMYPDRAPWEEVTVEQWDIELKREEETVAIINEMINEEVSGE